MIFMPSYQVTNRQPVQRIFGWRGLIDYNGVLVRGIFVGQCKRPSGARLQKNKVQIKKAGGLVHPLLTLEDSLTYAGEMQPIQNTIV